MIRVAGEVSRLGACVGRVQLCRARKALLLLPLLLLHSSVLEPDLHLRLAQMQSARPLGSSVPADVLIKVKRFLQFSYLSGNEAGASCCSSQAAS